MPTPAELLADADRHRALVAAYAGGTPAPVDCVLSAWGPWSAWGECVGGQQSRTRTRTIVTPPANGGAPCGPLTETETQACAPSGLPSWLPPVGQVKAISGPGTDAPGVLRDVLYGTPAGPGSGSGLSYFSNWCSGTYAPDYSQYGALAFACGGDGDYWGNEGYLFDLTTRAWKRIGKRSTGLNGVTTGGGDPNFNDSTWGEHTSPGGDPAPQPAIPHNYDAVLYLPPSLGGGPKGSLLLPTRSYCYRVRSYRHAHRLDLDTGIWHRASGTNPDTQTAWNIGGHPTPTWCWDAARGKAWGMGGGQGAVFSDRLMGYTFNASGVGSAGGVWPIPSILMPRGYPTSQHFPPGDLMLVIGIQNGTDTFIMLGGHLASMSGTVGFKQLTLTGDVIPFPHPGGSDAGGYGFAYCSDLNCFFVRTSAEHRQAIWKITPPASNYLNAAWAVQKVTMAGQAVASVGTFQGMWKRFNYVSVLKSLVWCDDSAGAVYAYRVV